MRLKIILNIIIIYLLASCSNSRSQNTNGEINSKYQEVLRNFKPEFIDHFPKLLDKKYIYDRWSMDPSDEFSLEVGIKISSEDGNLNQRYDSIKLASYLPSDSCLLILNRFATKDNYNNLEVSDVDLTKVDKKCYNNLFPIPNFWTSNYYTEETECHLPSDFRVFVLESKPGKFLDKSKLTTGQFMPTKWKNGFSKGVAISETRKVIIYWLIMW